MQISEAFLRPAGVRSSASARPPHVRPMTIQPLVSKGAETRAAMALIPGQRLAKFAMPHCQPSLGAVMCRQQQPQHAFLQS
jgi:hypothetical protein